MNNLIHKITLKLITYCESRGKVFIINGKDSDEAYLVRYLLVNTKWFNFYIHRFLKSDHDVPHDHPWDFLTYVVDGTYIERKFVGWDQYDGFQYGSMASKIRKKGSIAFRKATDIHKVQVGNLHTYKERELAPLTICITGPRRREWGFWDLSKGQFTRWTNYLGIENDSAKRG